MFAVAETNMGVAMTEQKGHSFKKYLSPFRVAKYAVLDDVKIPGFKAPSRIIEHLFSYHPYLQVLF